MVVDCCLSVPQQSHGENTQERPQHCYRRAENGKQTLDILGWEDGTTAEVLSRPSNSLNLYDRISSIPLNPLPRHCVVCVQATSLG